MTKLPRLSLVISTFNQPAPLAKVLAGFQLQVHWPDEILIADDGSEDPTRDLLAGFAARSPVPVQHVWHEHKGFRKTVVLNQSVLAATGDYLVFTDGDCVPHPKFIADHAELAERGFWIQGRRCFVREEFVRQFEPGRTPGWLWMLTGRITGSAKGVRWPLPIIRRDVKQRGIIGCNMAFWREDLLAVNGFDEDYSGWGVGEDSDIGTRLYHLGRRRKFVYGRAITFHLNHPQLPRNHHAASLARLAETISSRKVRCQRGLNQHPTT
ncbi:MAG TPA: glycosyltransferase family 2 protein [Candidatus Acidoferrum sp.]|jgi:glycosyltransferase involved in cell wall biosynthesis|nr:glycosyltransferase family 2 protein [Candidatus Acidoferrum sp.]